MKISGPPRCVYSKPSQNDVKDKRLLTDIFSKIQSDKLSKTEK